MTRTATFDPSRAVVFDLEVCPGRWCVGFHGIDHAGRLSTPRIRRPGTPKSSTDRTTTGWAGPAERSAPISANAGISIPIDARSIPRSVYTSGALRAWAEVFWISSRTHQLAPDGATGKGPVGICPWRSERSSQGKPGRYYESGRFRLHPGRGRPLLCTERLRKLNVGKLQFSASSRIGLLPLANVAVLT